jgi:hypothetical protein
VAGEECSAADRGGEEIDRRTSLSEGEAEDGRELAHKIESFSELSLAESSLPLQGWAFFCLCAHDERATMELLLQEAHESFLLDVQESSEAHVE